MAREEADAAICGSCRDVRRAAEPWCLRCETSFSESAPVTHAALRVQATRPVNEGDGVYICDDLPEAYTDYVQYLAYFAQLSRSRGDDAAQHAWLETHLSPLAGWIGQAPETTREGVAVYLLDNVYRGAASIRRVDGALFNYVKALGEAVAPILSSPQAVYAYVIDNSYDDADRFELVIDLLRAFGVVVSCPESLAASLVEHDTGAKARAVGLAEWPRYAAEAWGVALTLVERASAARRPLVVLSQQFDESVLKRIRSTLDTAGYTVVFRNEAPVTGSQVLVVRPHSA
jgi:hypothetical protein